MNECLDAHGTVADDYFITCRCSSGESRGYNEPHDHELGCPLKDCHLYKCPAWRTKPGHSSIHHTTTCPLFRKNPIPKDWREDSGRGIAYDSQDSKVRRLMTRIAIEGDGWEAEEARAVLKWCEDESLRLFNAAWSDGYAGRRHGG